ncbi:formate dehydrogenase accessory sulfurtransferase FdhD [Verrucomicrobiales bacterium BCK34]|nr:formate dehydrogenase accessory sulfurtransferase FdhD [Verrucomicrobiales bacterium BCK34]
MNADFSFDAALLAGGRSTRFGSDKAFLDWEGMPLYACQLRKLASLGPGKIWLSTNPDQAFPAILEGVERINDETPDLGPLGGLIRIFEASTADFVLILAVDLPLISAAFLKELIKSAQGTVPKQNGYWEPLAGFYPRREMLEILIQAREQDERKLQHLLNRAESLKLIEALEINADQSELFSNLNTPESFEEMARGAFDEAAPIRRYRINSGWKELTDVVAREDPLEVRINGKSIAVMMRTPGHDDELATGFLITESVIRSADEISEIAHCPDVDPEGIGNTLDVRLNHEPDLEALTRHVFTSSSCGVCGKATIESVFQNFPPVKTTLKPDEKLILSLPGKLREAQATFDRTGGLHASALFDAEGNLLLTREDVGRHNALDKVIGRACLDGIDTDNLILLVSGRISFELMQKALAARIGVVAGISAPSSLAVSLAKESGQTLVGFLRERGFNLYSGDLA